MTIRAPFHCDYGSNIRIGSGSFLNFNGVILGGVILDVVEVSIGDRTRIGPATQIHATGSVVTRDVPAGAIVVGNPARALS